MNSSHTFRKPWAASFLLLLLGLLSLTSAQAQIYVLNVNTGAVGKYGRDGSVINAALIPGIGWPKGLAVAGSNLVVADSQSGGFHQYAASGQAINGAPISDVAPWCIAVSGSNVFLGDPRKSTIGEYTLDGKTINAALIPAAKTPVALAVSGKNLFVVQMGDNTIGEYTTDGKTVNASLISGIQSSLGIAVSGTDLYVTNGGHGKVAKYTTDGNLVKDDFITGLSGPQAVAVSGPNIYVTSSGGGRNSGVVSVYTTGGKLVNSALITGLSNPAGIAVVDEGAEPVAVVHDGDPGTPGDHSMPPPMPKLPPRPRYNLPAVLVDSANYGTENNWIAHHIALRITTLCYLALHPDATKVPDFKITAQVDAQAHTVHLTIENFSASAITIDLKPDFAWDAAGYAPLATQLLGPNPPAPSGTIPPLPDLVPELLNLNGPRLANADMRFSAQLGKTPAWSAGHEQAALLLVSLALRDRASGFTDYRQILCRATAHLAVAQALRQKQDATLAGDIADAAIRTLSGRETDALDHLTALAAKPDLTDDARTWLTALRVRATGDWRPVPVVKDTPLLMKIMLAHVMADELTSLGAAQRLNAANNLENVPDWGRCALTNRLGVSVETGNTFAIETSHLELKELAEVLQIENAPGIDASNPGSTFAQPLQETVLAGQPATLHIIGPDMFTDVTRRHLLAQMRATGTYLTYMLGDLDSARTYADAMRKRFSDTRLFDLVPFTRANPNYVVLFTDLGAAHRQWEPWEMPMGVIPDCYAPIYPDVHTIHAFYADGLPFGTAYELYYRQGALQNAELLAGDKTPDVYVNPSPGVPRAVGDEMRTLAPDSFTAMEMGSLSARDIIQKSKPLWDYSLEPIAKIESSYMGYLHVTGHFTPTGSTTPAPQPASTNPDYALLLQKFAALDPDAYFQIGNSLREEGKPDEAAEADRKGFDQGSDQVAMSNAVGPLVDYYHDHGRDDEAEMVAKRAADVYSEKGLMIYAELLEKLGRLDEAEVCGKNIKDRYGSSVVLIRLYASHTAHFETRKNAELIFPNGMTKTDISSLPPGPPARGVRITTGSDLSDGAGLQVGDIIVALDSHQVDNTDQYTAISALSTDPGMVLIVWHRDHYVTIRASIPGRKLGVTLETVTQSGPAPPD